MRSDLFMLKAIACYGPGHIDILETAGAEYRHRLKAFYEILISSHS